MNYIVSIDQSTAGTKALLINSQGEIVCALSKTHAQYYPHKNWIEHDGEEIWRNVCALISRLIYNNHLGPENIDSITISNQRETTIVWDRATGEPVCHAVVWQCQRGTSICRDLSEYKQLVQERTGLVLSPYYPAAKLAWILRNVKGVMERARAGELCCGTIDSYLVYRLTKGARHVTDLSNASRTQLFNLKTLNWDDELLNIFGIPKSIMPKIICSDGDFGVVDPSTGFGGIPISSAMGDSHAALFGHGCLEKGMAKVTYGTGSSVMCNIGEQYTDPPKGLSLSLAWGRADKVQYVFEGNITCAGDTLKWLINELELVKDEAEIEALARMVENAGGVYLIPAFSGLGAPYFNTDVRASIVGISRSSNKTHIARAALESLAYQVTDVVDIMRKQCDITHFYASGGATVNSLLMQLQADYLGSNIMVTKEKELSALGAAYMGGLKTGFFKELPEDKELTVYEGIKTKEREKEVDGWKQAVSQALLASRVQAKRDGK